MEVLVLVLVGWQQRVEYSIHARLDTDAHTLFAVEQVTYHNASPHTLDTLFFHLYANAYRDTNTTYAREAAIMDDDRFLHSQEEDRGCIDVTRVLYDNQEYAFRSESTLLVIPLPSSLVPGDSVAVEIQFTLVFPKFFSRLGHDGEHYEVVQWYPKVCVFDDDGWHLDTYHALGEFRSLEHTSELQSVPASRVLHVRLSVSGLYRDP
ncbi:MAG: hypothetical protein JSW02_02390 [candidate division WOR-3 bacterium]|nr:MAG: hypothetical protein JSW02_02390 [candidate division WOR-3 bacterium]